MNLRPLICVFGLLILLIAACNRSNSFSENSNAIRQDAASIFFDKGKAAKDFREKISFFNKALRELEFKTDTLIPDILDYKIYYHVSLKEYDSSLYFSDSLINTARAQQDSTYLAKGYYRKASAFRNMNQYEKQFENSFASREIYLKIDDSSNAGRRTSEMATAQSQLTDYIGAQETATEALKYLTDSDSAYISSAYNTIATAYRNQGFYQDAVKEWRNALKYATRTRDSLSNLNNIALTLQDQKEYEEALEIFRNIIDRSNQTTKTSKARFIDNYAYTKWLQDSSAIVIDELLQAAAIRRDENDQNGLLASYDHLSDYYQFKSKRLSKIYADSLLQTAQNTNSKTAQLNALQKLIQLSPSNEIKDLSKRYIQLNDSIRKENIRAKNVFSKIKYDEEQKQREIYNLEAKTLKQQIETEDLRNQTIILSLGGLLLLVSSGFGFYYLRQKHSREKIRETHKTETRISKKIHDELANDVYNVMSGIQDIAPNDTMDKLENIYKRTRNISRENSSIPLGVNYLTHLVSTLSSSISENTRLILRGEESIKWGSLSPEKKIILYRVLQEMIINMNKHSQASLVAIIFSEEKNLLKIQYSDNGVGVSNESLRSGNGILNMENRIYSINGKLNFETEPGKGFKILIQIPL
ncbi:tetratricopeptide repeat-containing sensor histidine kinase [Christiangramia salexigens]|uniref:histidine kinase n=1 Tax=Christiangramia salexigens TaxID=1913577 RepID=A0A1L3J5C4_9FLAO|nr:tetratricopeptide repeat-containing sensor histidine kinase [Christiangramia salexigens]APG60335.1 histidine kinase [Christiangramia salexigens]